MQVSGFPRGSPNYFPYHRWNQLGVREDLGTVVGWKANDPKGS